MGWGSKKLQTFLGVFILTILGGLFRFINLTPYKIYPDFYQNILVAENISTYHSVIGRLGKMGMLYPDFFNWTRPGYSLIILLFHSFFHNYVFSAQEVSFLFAIATIPLVFVMLRKIFSPAIAWCGTILFTFSYTHIVWTGFSLTESLSIFLVTLLFTILFHKLSQKKQLGNLQDIYIGIVLGLCVFTRYEYILLFLPIAFLIRSQQRHFTICGGFLFTAIIFLVFLYPFQLVFFTAMSLVPLLVKFLAALVLGIILIFVIQRYQEKFINNSIITLTTYGLWTLDFFLFLSLFLFPHLTPFLGLRNFLFHDFLLQVAFLSGITIFRKEFKKNLYFFVITGIVLLGSLYQITNPEIERYMAHILPFLIIPASIGLYKFIQLGKRRRSIYILTGLFFLIQILLSGSGLRQKDNGTWFVTSYDEEAAKYVSKNIPTNAILLVSFPESYYFYSNISTYSIIDKPPFFYIPKNLNTKIVVIVDDIGMRQLFPNFSHVIETTLQRYKTKTIWVKRDYRFSDIVMSEKTPITLYAMPLTRLIQTLNDTYSMGH